MIQFLSIEFKVHCLILQADEPDLCWRYTAPIKDGVYSVLEDDELRRLTRFPWTPFCIYDICTTEFVGIPTFSHIEVRDDEYLILRNSRCSVRPQDIPTLWASISELLAQTRISKARHAESTPTAPATTPTPMQLPTPTTSRSQNLPNTTLRRSRRVHELASSSPPPPSSVNLTPTRVRKRKRQSN